ncbi:hypothetical protein AB4Y90_12940 [Chryseobacterium sp. 2TAF14]|uniref:hypothetical protein n=1 Tax=Chryseobacterium sp. 2TAF14 TaxID=3233007 RepID=UPI003F8F1882
MRIICLFSILIIQFSCTKKYTGKVSFKSCHIKYDVLDKKKEQLINGQNMVGNQWRFESAKQELALCLCEEYLKNKDEDIKQKILEIYQEDLKFYHRQKSFKKIDFDSILQNRKEIFDYRILVD